MYRILYRFLTSLARLGIRTGRSKDLEIAVLRHQLGVLHRQNPRPVLTDDDRSMLGAIAQALPRPHRSLDQRPPLYIDPPVLADRDQTPFRVIRSTRCHGLINEYKNAA